MQDARTSPVGPRLSLLQGSISYDTARRRDNNVLQQLSYPSQRFNFFLYLFERQDGIKEIVSRHLGLKNHQHCRLGDFSEWMHGTFNVCIPVYICNWNRRPKHRVLIRFPLPYKLGESSNPGNMDEKVRSEAATYIWMRRNCPNVRLPYLWGFGFGGLDVCALLRSLLQKHANRKSQFTACENAPWYARCLSVMQNLLRLLLRQPLPCPYIPQRRMGKLAHFGYLLMDFIEEEEGKMLSTTWTRHSCDTKRRDNLFRDLSKIMLSLTSVPLSHIGSLTINDQGILSLTNRPLSILIPEAENDSCPPIIDRNHVYSTVESYVLDLFTYHDNRIRYQPNSVGSIDDGIAQIEALTAMRACLPTFLPWNSRYGPFFLNLSDLHQSNIFVDDDWHIKYILDLEWACSRPIEMIRPPLWLVNHAIDDLVDEKLANLKAAHDEFLTVLDQEEKASLHNNSVSLAETMRNNWSTGRLWYFRALDSLTGLYGVFLNNIEPMFNAKLDKPMARYWHIDAERILQQRAEDRKKYDLQLQQAFTGEASLDVKPL